GLVEEEDVGVEGHGPGQPRALLHSPADLRRVKILEAAEPHERELESGDLADLGGSEIGELAQGEAHILGESHGAPQGSALVEHAEATDHELAPVVVRAPEARPVEEDVALGGADQPDEVSEQRALPAAAASHDDEDLPARHVEGEVALDDEVAVGHG